ncbi:hypothetical protein V8E52_005235 [Russula decolorans]
MDHPLSCCDRCAIWFPGNQSLEQHKRDSSVHWPCYDCGRDFGSSYARQEHYRQSPNHHYCRDCNRHFQDENNLRQHLNSRIHQPAKVHCPGQGCNRSFVSPATLTLHFESGTCPSGMTCEQLNRLVVHADTNNYITNPSRLLTGPLALVHLNQHLKSPCHVHIEAGSCGVRMFRQVRDTMDRFTSGFNFKLLTA